MRSLLQPLVFLCALLAIGCATRRDVTQVDAVAVHMFRREHANTYLLVQDKAMVLVDSGLERNAVDLDNDIHDAGFDPKQIRALVVTHGHADHAGGAKYFKDKYGVPIVAGAGDRDMLQTGKMDHLCPTDIIGQLRNDTDQSATYAPTSADVWIDARKSLAEIGGVTGEIVPLSGHTKGSLVVLIPNAAFVGDLFRGSIPDFSAERHFYMCDIADNDADIRALLGMGPFQTFFTGHFGPVNRLAVETRFVLGQ